MIYTFEATREGYASLWRSMAVKQEKLVEVDAVARKVIANKSRYLLVSSKTGVPWFMVGCIHDRESGLRFDCHLHNGDPLSARTFHVPAGRPIAGSPPFSWEDSACDALRMRALDQVKEWPIERILFELEAYNGWGYRNYHHINTPYLWSFTNQYSSGKYVADGKWDSAAVDQQIGGAALFSRLMWQDDSIGSDLTKTPEPNPAQASLASSLTQVLVSFFRK